MKVNKTSKRYKELWKKYFSGGYTFEDANANLIKELSQDKKIDVIYVASIVSIVTSILSIAISIISLLRH